MATSLPTCEPFTLVNGRYTLRIFKKRNKSTHVHVALRWRGCDIVVQFKSKQINLRTNTKTRHPVELRPGCTTLVCRILAGRVLHPCTCFTAQSQSAVDGSRGQLIVPTKCFALVPLFKRPIFNTLYTRHVKHAAREERWSTVCWQSLFLYKMATYLANICRCSDQF